MLATCVGHPYLPPVFATCVCHLCWLPVLAIRIRYLFSVFATCVGHLNLPPVFAPFPVFATQSIYCLHLLPSVFAAQRICYLFLQRRPQSDALIHSALRQHPMDTQLLIGPLPVFATYFCNPMHLLPVVCYPIFATFIATQSICEFATPIFATFISCVSTVQSLDHCIDWVVDQVSDKWLDQLLEKLIPDDRQRLNKKLVELFSPRGVARGMPVSPKAAR